MSLVQITDSLPVFIVIAMHPFTKCIRFIDNSLNTFREHSEGGEQSCGPDRTFRRFNKRQLIPISKNYSDSTAVFIFTGLDCLKRIAERTECEFVIMERTKNRHDVANTQSRMYAHLLRAWLF